MERIKEKVLLIISVISFACALLMGLIAFVDDLVGPVAFENLLAKLNVPFNPIFNRAWFYLIMLLLSVVAVVSHILRRRFQTSRWQAMTTLEKLKTVLERGHKTEKIEFLSHLNDIFESYNKDIQDFNEIMNVLIEYAAKEKNDEILDEVLNTINFAETYRLSATPTISDLSVRFP